MIMQQQKLFALGQYDRLVELYNQEILSNDIVDDHTLLNLITCQFLTNCNLLSDDMIQQLQSLFHKNSNFKFCFQVCWIIRNANFPFANFSVLHKARSWISGLAAPISLTKWNIECAILRLLFDLDTTEATKILNKKRQDIDLATCISCDPSCDTDMYPRAMFAAALIYKNNSCTEIRGKAEEYCKKALLEATENSPIWLAASVFHAMLLSRESPSVALSILDRCVKSNFCLEYVHLLRGNIYLETNDYISALEELKIAIGIDNENENWSLARQCATYNVAVIQHVCEYYDIEQHLWKMLLDNLDSFDKIQTQQLWTFGTSNGARCCLHAHACLEQERIEYNYTRALLYAGKFDILCNETDIKPHNVEILAYALLEAEQFQEAERLCLHALEATPNDVHMLLYLADAKISLGEINMALKLFQEILHQLDRLAHPQSSYLRMLAKLNMGATILSMDCMDNVSASRGYQLLLETHEQQQKIEENIDKEIDSLRLQTVYNLCIYHWIRAEYDEACSKWMRIRNFDDLESMERSISKTSEYEWYASKSSAKNIDPHSHDMTISANQLHQVYIDDLSLRGMDIEVLNYRKRSSHYRPKRSSSHSSSTCNN